MYTPKTKLRVHGNSLYNPPACSPVFTILYSLCHYFQVKHSKVYMYIDFDTILFGQVEGHWKEKCKLRVWSIPFFWRNIRSLYFWQILHMTSECVMISTQDRWKWSFNIWILQFVERRRHIFIFWKWKGFLICKWSFLFETLKNL